MTTDEFRSRQDAGVPVDVEPGRRPVIVRDADWFHLTMTSRSTFAARRDLWRVVQTAPAGMRPVDGPLLG